MKQQKLCQDCNQKHNCQDIYQQLGHAKCPSVTLKAVTAFLLPLAVFIGALAVFETFSDQSANAGHLHILLGFLLAISAALIMVISIKVINRKLGKAK
jgi:heme A synthase